ncbi:DoxX family protein [Actinocatenispora rupis]|uniref:DoxX-like family protein n=1 Tax=Actinocatenispora rupis TaxID=519421 RepID=A0A8J3JA66_9ACTN|nr:DoxX family protein [Actinocatenispora rupis]GID12897.1 hypothetical protein Aru02nite_37860 [Actinocatenispora rupis]
MTHLVLALTAIALNTFSGTAAVLRWSVILPGMRRAGVPESWLVFPIGVLKLAGAAGIAVGLAVPVVGLAASIGLVLYFTCALYTHVRAGDYGAQFGLAFVFLGVAAANVALALT